MHVEFTYASIYLHKVHTFVYLHGPYFHQTNSIVLHKLRHCRVIDIAIAHGMYIGLHLLTKIYQGVTLS